MFFSKKREKKLVIHVEDEPDIRQMVHSALTPMGLDVMSASDGPSGLALILKEKPDLVILDVRMPGMDGFAVCESVREQEGFADLPILMATAMSQVKDIERAVAAGASGYVLKPFDISKLRHKVISTLGRPEGSGS